MPGEINYKSKYLELRSKYLSDVDMAFRLGFEQGQQQSQQQQMEQAQQRQMEQNQSMESPEAQTSNEAPVEAQEARSEHPEGSELDQHIAKLESMIAKSEPIDANEIRKYIGSIKKELELKKSEKSIKAISKALHKPIFNMSKQASHNLNSNAKQAVSLQHKIVNDIMAKMEAEEKRASNDIKNILGLEELTKG